MKKHCIAICLLLHVTVYAQIQRLAVMPTTAPVTVTKEKAVKLRSYCIDYFRKKPNYYTQYNTTVGGEQASVSITNADGEVSTITLEEALKGEQPILKIYAAGLYAATFSKISVTVNTQKADIKSVKINPIKKALVLASNPNDTKDLIAEAIFKTYGEKINQQTFWKKAVCIEVLKANNKYLVDDAGKLTSETVTIMNTLGAETLLETTEVNKLYSLLQKGEIKIQENGSLTEQTKMLLKNMLHKQ